jgi:L-ascorbate metabolism protein UlaG (beta-lactamase superfamily)
VVPGPERDEVGVTFVGHASVAIDLAGVRILTDPVLTMRLKHLRRIGSPPADFDPATVDLVAISHQHHDHLHVPSLKRLPRRAHVVVPRGLAPRLARLGFDRVTELTVGDTAWHGPVRVTAVPAAHDDRRHPGVARITPLGFVFDAPELPEGDVVGPDGGRRLRSVYFPGDTALYPDMASFTPDLTLIPVWGWGPTLGHGHLDPTGAAEALALLGSQVAVPIHWGTLWPYHVRPNDRLLLPPRELVTAVAERDVPVEVVELAPGASATLR